MTLPVRVFSCLCCGQTCSLDATELAPGVITYPTPLCLHCPGNPKMIRNNHADVAVPARGLGARKQEHRHTTEQIETGVK